MQSQLILSSNVLVLWWQELQVRQHLHVRQRQTLPHQMVRGATNAMHECCKMHVAKCTLQVWATTEIQLI